MSTFVYRGSKIGQGATGIVCTVTVETIKEMCKSTSLLASTSSLDALTSSSSSGVLSVESNTSAPSPKDVSSSKIGGGGGGLDVGSGSSSTPPKVRGVKRKIPPPNSSLEYCVKEILLFDGKDKKSQRKNSEAQMECDILHTIFKHKELNQFVPVLHTFLFDGREKRMCIQNTVGGPSHGLRMRLLAMIKMPMELEAVRLRTRKLDGSGDEAICRHFFRQLCTCMEKLHRHGIAHRDIKGTNIMVDWECKTWIIDFAHGKLFRPGLNLSDPSIRTELRCEMKKKGTPGYRPSDFYVNARYPEIYTPTVKSGGYSAVEMDVAMAGVELFRMMTGKYPYGRCLRLPDHDCLFFSNQEEKEDNQKRRKEFNQRLRHFPGNGDDFFKKYPKVGDKYLLIHELAKTRIFKDEGDEKEFMTNLEYICKAFDLNARFLRSAYYLREEVLLECLSRKVSPNDELKRYHKRMCELLTKEGRELGQIYELCDVAYDIINKDKKTYHKFVFAHVGNWRLFWYAHYNTPEIDDDLKKLLQDMLQGNAANRPMFKDILTRYEWMKKPHMSAEKMEKLKKMLFPRIVSKRTVPTDDGAKGIRSSSSTNLLEISEIGLLPAMDPRYLPFTCFKLKGFTRKAQWTTLLAEIECLCKDFAEGKTTIENVSNSARDSFVRFVRFQSACNDLPCEESSCDIISDSSARRTRTLEFRIDLGRQMGESTLDDSYVLAFRRIQGPHKKFYLLFEAIRKKLKKIDGNVAGGVESTTPPPPPTKEPGREWA